MNYPSIRIEGAILSPDLIDRLPVTLSLAAGAAINLDLITEDAGHADHGDGLVLATDAAAQLVALGRDVAQRQRGRQRVGALVQRIGLEMRPDEVGDLHRSGVRGVGGRDRARCAARTRAPTV